jgi:flagellar biogenesis protein FliO
VPLNPRHSVIHSQFAGGEITCCKENRWAFAIVSLFLLGIALLLIWLFKRIKWL